MGPNEATMGRLVDAVEDFLVAGQKQSLRFVHRHLVAGPPRKGTPKDTGFAAGWIAGVGSPPSIEPGRPELPRYPLRGDAELDQDLSDMEMGSGVVFVSPAIYIGVLAKGGHSPQQPEPDWIPEAIDEAVTDLKAWRYEAA